MWDLLFKTLAKKRVELNEEEVEIVQKLFVHKSFRKHQYILQQGEVCRYESFVVKGIARKYQVDEKGQEHILQFSPEDWWASDLNSFLNQEPSLYNIDCLEDTEVLRISRQDLDILYEKVPKMINFFRLLYQNCFIASSQRLGSALSKTGVELYEDFVKRYPTIEQRIPNHQIAAFLGLTPQSLSRIRKQAMAASKRNYTST